MNVNNQQTVKTNKSPPKTDLSFVSRTNVLKFKTGPRMISGERTCLLALNPRKGGLPSEEHIFASEKQACLACVCFFKELFRVRGEREDAPRDPGVAMVNMHFLLKSKLWQETSVSCQLGSHCHF